MNVYQLMLTVWLHYAGPVIPTIGSQHPMNPLATPENVAALDRAAEWISKPQRWCRGVRSNRNRFCALGAVGKFDQRSYVMLLSYNWPGASLHFALDDHAFALYNDEVTDVNDVRGRIPAKHCLKSLAAQLRSELP